MNGDGDAIALNGHQFAVYEGLPDDAMFPEELTLSAWITLPTGGVSGSINGVPLIWPILSTLGDTGHCGGYQLDLRVEDEATGPELVFTYQYGDPGDAGAPCELQRVAYPVDNSPWGWGNGRWHHVAASRQRAGWKPERSILGLYWDGVRLNATTGASTSGQLVYSDYRLFVGTNAASASTPTTKFKGNIDEIAVFDTVLDDTSLRDFALATTARPGPSGCRWTISEEWDDVTLPDSGSRVWWSPDSNPESLRVDVLDSDWGAGIISAHLSPVRDLSDYGAVHLLASTPNQYLSSPNGANEPNGTYQFSIFHGLDYCTWILAAGGPESRDIPLSTPSYCASSTCQFPVTSVDAVRVTTDWKDVGSETLHLAVSELNFRRDGEKPDASQYGGVIGPRGWCWRPIAHEIGALARFVGSPSPAEVTAILSGSPNSSSRLSADFGSRVLDLSQCDSVSLMGEIPVSPSQFTFKLQDIYGGWVSWYLLSDGTHIGNVRFGDLYADFSYQSIKDASYKYFREFDFAKVNQISIQKPLNVGDTMSIKITDLQFKTTGCEHWGTP
jgi:hypothetical protein